MKQERFYQAMITFYCFVAMLSLCLVEKQPILLVLTAICFIAALYYQDLLDDLINIRSSADEDRPE